MKNIALILLAATCLIQWYVPASMIFQQEKTLKNGTVFKFKTRPVDPNDPFRGKYVVLNYEADIFEVNSLTEWSRGEEVFVKIKNDTKGFAMIAALEKEISIGSDNYVKAKVRRVWGKNPTKVSVKYPFERFYMEETKAPKAEQLFRRVSRDSSTIAYSLVMINKGEAALEDVMINGISIKNATEN